MKKNICNSPDSSIETRRFSVILISILLIGIVICVGLIVDKFINNKPVFELLNLNFFYTKDKILGFSCLMLFFIGLFIMGISYFIVDLVENNKNICLYLFLVSFLIISISTIICIVFDTNLRQQPLRMIAFILYGLWISIMLLPSVLAKIGYKYIARISWISFIFISMGFIYLESLLV
jgi:F0F1-type ATP synthase assembly protein I